MAAVRLHLDEIASDRNNEQDAKMRLVQVLTHHFLRHIHLPTHHHTHTDTIKTHRKHSNLRLDLWQLQQQKANKSNNAKTLLPPAHRRSLTNQHKATQLLTVNWILVINSLSCYICCDCLLSFIPKTYNRHNSHTHTHTHTHTNVCSNIEGGPWRAGKTQISSWQLQHNNWSLHEDED